MDRLKGKVAIITGAAKGIGEADARLFVQEGAQVILTDVDVENGERVASEIGPQAAFMPLDVRKETEWKKLVDAVLQRYGQLNVLVNNAAVVELHTPETITEEELRFVMEVSLHGTIFGCKHAIPAMKQSGGGSIINMASVASIIGEPAVVAYAAAKGAIESYTRAVAVHCAQNRLNIRCNSIHPSTMDTPMVQSIPDKIAAAHMEAMFEEKAALEMPVGAPIEVAYMAVYLASDESRFVSGAKMVMDMTSTITQGAVPPLGEV